MNTSDPPASAVLVLRPPLRLDTTSSPAFEEELIGKIDGTTYVVLDFSEVVYISSAGLRVLLIAAKRTAATKGRIALCGLKDNCLRVLEISGFVRFFTIHPSVEAATAA